MQGFNMGRYRPPSSLDPSLEAQTTKAAGGAKPARSATKPSQPPTVRFEMPFAIWCSTCPTYSSSQLIGQGVRFNAQKKRVGNYFSTPIWQFRMKHAACGGWIEIRTDPKNSEYVVSEGARKRDTGDDLAVAGRVGGVVIGGSSGPGEDTERARMKEDAFAALEGRKEEKSRAVGEAKRLDELRSLRSRDWKDADAANRRIRNTFRVGRRKRDRDAESGEVLKERMGLDMDIVEEHEEDARRAGFVEFGAAAATTAADETGDIGLEAARKPLFGNFNSGSNKTSTPTSISRTEALQKELSSNTKVASDPFSLTSSSPNGVSSTGWSIPGIKRRKRPPEDSTWDPAEPLNTNYYHDPKSNETAREPLISRVALVNYDSE